MCNSLLVSVLSEELFVDAWRKNVCVQCISKCTQAQNVFARHEESLLTMMSFLIDAV